MPRTPRNQFDTGFFHIISQGINKEYIFNEECNKQKYLYLLKKYSLKFKIKIISYCIMDNHVHLLVYSNQISEISKYMHNLNLSYSQYYNKKYNRVGYVFRDRYKSQYIYDRNYLFKCIKYIHMNPVKADMVKNEKDYKYSSYNEYAKGTKFIDEFIKNEVFVNLNYIQILDSIYNVDIEIIDVDNQNENLQNAVKNYLSYYNFTIEDIKKDNCNILCFSKYLISKGFKKKKIAEAIKISQSKLSKIIAKGYPQTGKF